MRRVMMVMSAMTLVAMAATAHAGGMAPGTPGPKVKISGPTVNGVMVVDAHTDGTTSVTAAGGGFTESKSKLASIWLQRGGATASAIFRLPLAFAAGLGCDLTVTDARFAFDATKFNDNDLKNWMPAATVDALVTALGLNPATAGDPVITSIANAVCTHDPENPSPSVGTEGILSFQLNLQFIQP